MPPMSMSRSDAREAQLQQWQQALATGHDLGTRPRREHGEGVVELAGAVVVERGRDHAWPPFADCIARHTVWAVYGMSR